MVNPVKIEISVFAGALPIPDGANIESSSAAYTNELQIRLALEFPGTEVVISQCEAIVYNTALRVSFADGATNTDKTIATINHIQQQLQKEPVLWVVVE